MAEAVCIIEAVRIRANTLVAESAFMSEPTAVRSRGLRTSPEGEEALLMIFIKTLALAGGANDVSASLRYPLAISELFVSSGPGIREGGSSVDDLSSGIDLQPGLEVAGGIGKGQFDAAEGVDDVGEAAELDLQIMVRPDAGGQRDCFHEKVRPTERIGGIDLLGALTGNSTLRSRGIDSSCRRPFAT